MLQQTSLPKLPFLKTNFPSTSTFLPSIKNLHEMGISWTSAETLVHWNRDTKLIYSLRDHFCTHKQRVPFLSHVQSKTLSNRNSSVYATHWHFHDWQLILYTRVFPQSKLPYQTKVANRKAIGGKLINARTQRTMLGNCERPTFFPPSSMNERVKKG